MLNPKGGETVTAKEKWFNIRGALLGKGLRQEGANLFIYEGGTAAIYTFTNTLTPDNLVDIISKSKGNIKFSLPLTVVVPEDMVISPECGIYQNILKKELKIAKINEFNISNPRV